MAKFKYKGKEVSVKLKNSQLRRLESEGVSLFAMQDEEKAAENLLNSSAAIVRAALDFKEPLDDVIDGFDGVLDCINAAGDLAAEALKKSLTQAASTPSTQTESA